MTALQARVAGVINDETQVAQMSQAAAGAASQTVRGVRRNRRRPGLSKATGMQFPLFHAWRP
ncbi:MAG TPA: hypothetical protein VIG90_09325 [Pedomonas sp.]|uniref:hypothetical protein n=1 Tax=Pedomonas sp. TaxID=2976421 RepID=UPI002F3E7704